MDLLAQEHQGAGRAALHAPRSSLPSTMLTLLLDALTAGVGCSPAVAEALVPRRGLVEALLPPHMVPLLQEGAATAKKFSRGPLPSLLPTLLHMLRFLATAASVASRELLRQPQVTPLLAAVLQLYLARAAVGAPATEGEAEAGGAQVLSDCTEAVLALLFNTTKDAVGTSAWWCARANGVLDAVLGVARLSDGQHAALAARTLTRLKERSAAARAVLKGEAFPEEPAAPPVAA